MSSKGKTKRGSEGKPPAAAAPKMPDVLSEPPVPAASVHAPSSPAVAENHPAEGKSSHPRPARAAKPRKKGSTAEEVAEMLKPHIERLVSERAGEAEGRFSERLNEVSASVGELVTELEGTGGKDGNIVEGEGNDAKARPSVLKSVSDLRQRVDLLDSVLRSLLGENFGRLHALIVSHEVVTRKLVTMAICDPDYLERVKQVAIEQEPNMAKMILEAFIADKEIVKLSLAQTKPSLVREFDDPGAKRSHDWGTNDLTMKIIARAKQCIEQIDWEECEKANRKMIFGEGERQTRDHLQ